MNKNKGFTLIELLAVIVVLAVISLIATPIVLNMVNTAKKGAVEASATAYIKAVENGIMAKLINEPDTSFNGIFTVSQDKTKIISESGTEINVDIKGDLPSSVQVIIEAGDVKTAKLCINNYSLDYDGKVVKASNNEYCEGKVILNINGEKIEKQIASKIEFDITGKDISNITNIVCNNGANVTVGNNKVTVSNVVGKTICTMNTTLEETANNLDSTPTYIMLLNDTNVTNNIDFGEDTNVRINLNSKQVNLNGKYFRAYGDLIIDGNQNSKIFSTKQVVNNSGNGTVTINGGNYERTGTGGTAIFNEGTGTIIINNGTYINNGDKTVVQNRLNISFAEGDIIINGGVFISNGYNAISNHSSNGTITINQTDTPIYIVALAQKWNPAIENYGTGTINIKGNSANECTNDYTKTTSGLCVYAEGDKNYSKNTANAAVANMGDGIINVDGGTYYGGNMGISNHYNGTVNIKNGDISSGWMAIFVTRTATTNICGVNISSSKYDLLTSGTDTTTGTINYSSLVKFTKGTNTPVKSGKTTNIKSNYTGTCS